MPELFVPLDTNWADNPKVIEVGLDGAGLHAAAMCLAKRMETDGVIHRSQLARYGATAELIDRLVDAALFDVIDDRRVRVHDWLDSNLSSDAIRSDRDGRRDAARKANHKRWGHSGPVEKCARCNPPTHQTSGTDPSGNSPKPQRDPTTDTGHIRPDSDPRSDRTPSESESASLRERERGREIERDPSSSLPSPEDPRTDDDDQIHIRVETAIGVLAQADLDHRQRTPNLEPIHDHGSYLDEATRRRRIRHATQLTTKAREHPDLSPELLAASVDQPPGPAPPPGPNPWSRRVDIEDEHATAARLEAQHSDPPDPERNLNALANARQKLPSTPPESQP